MRSASALAVGGVAFLDLTVFFFRDIKKFKENTFKVLVIVLEDLHKFGVLNNSYSHLFDNLLDFAFDIIVAECIRVNDW